jgi:hypothetical protein
MPKQKRKSLLEIFSSPAREDRLYSDVPRKNRTFLDAKLNELPRDVSPAQHNWHGGRHWNTPENRRGFGPGTKDKMPGADNRKPKSYKLRGVT